MSIDSTLRTQSTIQYNTTTLYRHQHIGQKTQRMQGVIVTRAQAIILKLTDIRKLFTYIESTLPNVLRHPRRKLRGLIQNLTALGEINKF